MSRPVVAPALAQLQPKSWPLARSSFHRGGGRGGGMSGLRAPTMAMGPRDDDDDREADELDREVDRRALWLDMLYSPSLDEGGEAGRGTAMADLADREADARGIFFLPTHGGQDVSGGRATGAGVRAGWWQGPGGVVSEFHGGGEWPGRCAQLARLQQACARRRPYGRPRAGGRRGDAALGGGEQEGGRRSRRRRRGRKRRAWEEGGGVEEVEEPEEVESPRRWRSPRRSVSERVWCIRQGGRDEGRGAGLAGGTGGWVGPWVEGGILLLRVSGVHSEYAVSWGE